MTRRAPHLVRLSTVAAEEVEHLDAGRLMLRKTTLLSGLPGTGKSWISASIAANLSAGRPIWPASLCPECTPRPPANVLMLAGEDGIADTIRPRVDALEGDPDRIYVMPGILIETEDGGIREIDVQLDKLDDLRTAIEDVQPTLIIVDTVTEHFPAGADANKAVEVRAALRGIARLTEDANAALLLIHHLNKTQTGPAIFRSSGSLDFVAIARSVLITGEHEGRPALAHAKVNVTRKAPTLLYTLEHGTLAWTGTSDATADDLVNTPHQAYTGNARQEAIEFLQEHLTHGPLKAAELQQLAQRAGIKDATLRRAKKELNLVTQRIGTPGGSGYFTWELPSPNGHPEHLEHHEHHEHQDHEHRPEHASSRRSREHQA
jgi:putative DNA primase/helicase